MQIYINKILNILEKYNFDYLNEDLYDNKLELKIEYMGDDLIFKDRYLDFDNKHEYWTFANTQADIVCDNFEKGLEELKEKNLTYPILNWEWDYDDYPCIYIYINTDALKSIETHNKSLDFTSSERQYLTINDSGFMVDNEYRVIEKELIENEFNDLSDLSNKRECICDCNNCSYCSRKNHFILIEELR